MTKPLYLMNTYLFTAEARLLKSEEDEKGPFVILDQTIFYPQGGGQPSDQGIIQHDPIQASVMLVRQVGEEIRHYINLPVPELPLNSPVKCLVDKERRLLNSKYHTAGHLLSNIGEVIYPHLKAIKGHSFPGEAYVEFQGEGAVNPIDLQESVEEAIARDDKTKIFETDPVSFEQQFYKLPYAIPDNKKFRVMQIGNLPPVPCGGTHLSSVGEIGKMIIGKVKHKNDIVRISYGIQ